MTTSLHERGRTRAEQGGRVLEMFALRYFKGYDLFCSFVFVIWWPIADGLCMDLQYPR